MIAMERIGNENRGAAGQCDFGYGHGARASNHEIGLVKGGRHVVDERYDPRISPELLITLRHQPHIRLARLVYQLQIYNSFIPNFEGIQDRSEEHTSELQSPVHLVC